MNPPGPRGGEKPPAGSRSYQQSGRLRLRARKETSALTAVGDILRQASHALGIEPAVHLVEARQAWAGLVGPALARVSRVVSLRGEVLLVAAAHPLAAQEIRLRREDILASLSRRVAPLRRLQVVIRPGSKTAETPTESGF